MPSGLFVFAILARTNGKDRPFPAETPPPTLGRPSRVLQIFRHIDLAAVGMPAEDVDLSLATSNRKSPTAETNDASAKILAMTGKRALN
ncbi:MAG: hypothetical protein WCJ35_07270 [Planctomycetota bacterium]